MAQADFMPFSALAAKGETDLRAVHTGVVVAHRRQPVGTIFADVFVVSHANQRHFQQPDDGREQFFERHAAAGEIALHPPAHARQSAGEGNHAVELVVIALLAPV